MKTNIYRNLCMAALLGASMATYGQADAARTNPFLTEYTTPYGVPPFEQVTVADYREAFLKGMEEQKQEINVVARCSHACPSSLADRTVATPRPSCRL